MDDQMPFTKRLMDGNVPSDNMNQKGIEEMAKRKAKAAGKRPGKTRVELRLDEDVFERIKNLADGAEVTVNQLVNALVRWAGDNGHAGEPYRNADGVLLDKEMAGVVWFGKHGHYLSDEEKEMHWHSYDEQAPEFHKGERILTLDFTERRVIVEDD